MTSNENNIKISREKNSDMAKQSKKKIKRDKYILRDEMKSGRGGERVVDERDGERGGEIQQEHR